MKEVHVVSGRIHGVPRQRRGIGGHRPAVVASSATHQQGNEAAIFNAVFWHSIVLASLVALIVLAYAYLFPGAIPQ